MAEKCRYFNEKWGSGICTKVHSFLTTEKPKGTPKQCDFTSPYKIGPDHYGTCKIKGVQKTKRCPGWESPSIVQIILETTKS